MRTFLLALRVEPRVIKLRTLFRTLDGLFSVRFSRVVCFCCSLFYVVNSFSLLTFEVF